MKPNRLLREFALDNLVCVIWQDKDISGFESVGWLHRLIIRARATEAYRGGLGPPSSLLKPRML